jgi:hypothetical protein
VQIDVSEAQDGSEIVDSAAMKAGITNLLQVGDLPTLGGDIQPTKYWALTTDGDDVKLKGPAARQAADDKIAADQQKRQRRARLERRINNRQRRDAIAAVHADTDMTVAERDELLGEITGD